MRELIEATKKMKTSSLLDALDAFPAGRKNKYPLSYFPKKILPAGTSLFHGTDSEGDYDMVDGPAWFAHDHDTAEEWAGWAYTPPEGRTKGDKRVLEFVTTQDVELFDIEEPSTYFELNFTINGDPEYPHMDFARTLIAKTGLGWYSFNEIMLPDPAAVLRPVQTSFLSEASLDEIDTITGFGTDTESWIERRQKLDLGQHPGLVEVGDVGDMMVSCTNWPLRNSYDVNRFFFHDGSGNLIGHAELVYAPTEGFTNTYRVRMIYLNASHRKSNNAFAFYEMLLGNGVTLRSDTEQTEAGKGIWKKLARTYRMHRYDPGLDVSEPIVDISDIYDGSDELVVTGRRRPLSESADQAPAAVLRQMLRWTQEELRGEAAKAFFENPENQMWFEQSLETLPETVTIYRNQHNDDSAQYSRYTSWTLNPAWANEYGSPRKRTVVSRQVPRSAIAAYVPAFGSKVDWLRQEEVILKPVSK
jgi:hypothetical protein